MVEERQEARADEDGVGDLDVWELLQVEAVDEVGEEGEERQFDGKPVQQGQQHQDGRQHVQRLRQEPLRCLEVFFDDFREVVQACRNREGQAGEPCDCACNCEYLDEHGQRRWWVRCLS